MGDVVRLRLPKEARSAARARRAVEELRSKLPPDLLGDTRFLVNEVVTNSIIHSEGDGDISLTIAIRDDVIRVEVEDPGSSHSPASAVPEPEASAGRGLFLVEQLSDRWGTIRAGTTSVWFEIDRGNGRPQIAS